MAPIANLHSALKMYTLLFKVFGLTSYDFDTSVYKFRFTKTILIVLLIKSLLIVGFIYQSIKTITAEPPKYLRIMLHKFMAFFQISLLTSFYLIYLIFFDFYKHNLWKIFQLNNLIEQQLNSIKCYTNYEEVFKFGLKNSLLFFAITVLIISVDYKIICARPMEVFTIFFPGIINDIMICFLVSMLYNVRCKYMLVNKSIYTLRKRSSEINFLKLNQLIGTYKYLRTYCAEINGIYNSVLGGIFLTGTAITIKMVYFIFIDVERERTFVFPILFWNISVVCKTIFVLYNFNCIRNEVISIVIISNST